MHSEYTESTSNENRENNNNGMFSVPLITRDSPAPTQKSQVDRSLEEHGSGESLDVSSIPENFQISDDFKSKENDVKFVNRIQGGTEFKSLPEFFQPIHLNENSTGLDEDLQKLKDKNLLLDRVLESINIDDYIDYLESPREMRMYRKKKHINMNRPMILSQELNKPRNHTRSDNCSRNDLDNKDETDEKENNEEYYSEDEQEYSDNEDNDHNKENKGCGGKKTGSNRKLMEKLKKRKRDMDHIIWCLEFSKNGMYLASGDKRGVLKVWKVLSTPLERLQLKEKEQELKKKEKSTKYRLQRNNTASTTNKQSSHTSDNTTNKDFFHQNGKLNLLKATTSPNISISQGSIVPMKSRNSRVSSLVPVGSGSLEDLHSGSEESSLTSVAPRTRVSRSSSVSTGNTTTTVDSDLITTKSNTCNETNVLNRNNNKSNDKKSSSTSFSPVFNPEPYRVFPAHTADILCMDWSNNSDFLLTGSQDKDVKLWHINKKEHIKKYQHPDFVTGVKFHPKDDRFFLSGCLDHYLRLFSILDNKVASEFNCQDLITCLECSPDEGKFTVVGTFNGYVFVFLTKKLRMIACFHVSKNNNIETIRNEHTDYMSQNRKPALDENNNNSNNIIGSIVSGPKITGVQFIKCANPENDTSNLNNSNNNSSSSLNTARNQLKLVVTSNDSKIRFIDFQKSETLEILKGFSNSSMQLKACAGVSNDNKPFVIAPSEDHWLYAWRLKSLMSEHDKQLLEQLTQNYHHHLNVLAANRPSALIRKSLANHGHNLLGTRDSRDLGKPPGRAEKSPNLMKKLFNAIKHKNPVTKTRDSPPRSQSIQFEMSKPSTPRTSSLGATVLSAVTNTNSSSVVKNNIYMAFHAHHNPVSCVKIIPKNTEKILAISNDFIYEVSSIFEDQAFPETFENMYAHKNRFKTGIKRTASIKAFVPNTSTPSVERVNETARSSSPGPTPELGIFSAITAGIIIVSADTSGVIRVFRMDLPKETRLKVLETLKEKRKTQLQHHHSEH